MINQIVLDPLLDWPWVWGLGVAAVFATLLALVRGAKGGVWRMFSALALLGILLNPSIQSEEREILSDIVLVVVDRTASQTIAGRQAQADNTLGRIEADIAARENTDIRIVSVGDSDDDRGTLLMAAMSEALAQIPANRLAGVLLITDGQVHDVGQTPLPDVPVHALLTGKPGEWDRRLSVISAPPFGILNEDVMLTVQIDDLGATEPVDRAALYASVDGGPEQRFVVPVGSPVQIPFSLTHGGMNTVQFSVPVEDGELTDRNNAAIIRINGVRDRLRVLLVSGTPHAGERTWRNLLKSDSSVDLVHFTILRPPDRQDGVPVNELSLIAFPTRELFMDKIDDFDLIIFDRYRLRGILPAHYISSVADYVRRGGAVLISAGPDFAGAESLYHSPLGQILPARPTARVIEGGFVPQISDLGQRHPVTEGLYTVTAESDGPEWGRWLRRIDLLASPWAQTVMTGEDGEPLLVLSRVEQGRVALLGSDHIWLWSRGYEGGGPQLELLRRLAHWMMREPELEEEALFATAIGQDVTVIRRTLNETTPNVQITSPSGEVFSLSLEETETGRFEGAFRGTELGLYRLSDGLRQAVIALGPSSPREYLNVISTDEVLEPVFDATSGVGVRLSDGVPALRDVRAGRPAAGRGWIGLIPRNAYLTTSISRTELLAEWIWVLMAAGFMLIGWLREGRDN